MGHQTHHFGEVTEGNINEKTLGHIEEVGKEK